MFFACRGKLARCDVALGGGDRTGVGVGFVEMECGGSGSSSSVITQLTPSVRGVRSCVSKPTRGRRFSVTTNPTQPPHPPRPRHCFCAKYYAAFARDCIVVRISSVRMLHGIRIRKLCAVERSRLSSVRELIAIQWAGRNNLWRIFVYLLFGLQRFG